jgi:phosphoglycerate kinase
LRRILPTLEHAMARDARVIVATHATDAQNLPSSKKSLESFGARLSEATGWEVFLPDDCLSDSAKRVIGDLRSNQICLLENLMFHAEEQTADDAFARSLAAYADVFVNDAFASSRHAWASLTTLPRLMRNRGAGIALAKEVEALDGAKSPERAKLLYLIGGGATDSRLDSLEPLLKTADKVVLGAELGRLFLAAQRRAAPGWTTEAQLARARSIFDRAESKLLLPCDFSIRSAESADDMVVKPAGLEAASELLDVGPESLVMIEAELKRAKTALLAGKLHAALDTPETSTAAVCRALGPVENSLLVGSEVLGSLRKSHPDLVDQVGHIAVDEEAAFDWLMGRRFFGIESLTGASNE